MQTPTGFPWLPVMAIVGSLLGGGAMGALINSYVSRYRSKRQPVAYSIETIEVFKQHPDFPSLQAYIGIGDDPDTGEPNAHALLSNFSIVRVKVINKGNQDIADFGMGITLERDTQTFDIKVETIDRHHEGEILTPVNFKDSRNELDFSLRPFNRKDSYIITLYVTYKESMGKVSVSSAHSTTFVAISTGKEETRQNFVFLYVTNGLWALAILVATFLSEGFFANPFHKTVLAGLMVIFAIFITPLLVWKAIRNP